MLSQEFALTQPEGPKGLVLSSTTSSDEYQRTSMEFYTRHVCRLSPWPSRLEKAFEEVMSKPELDNAMWGPSEFFPTGTLKDWDVTDRLREIRYPKLILADQIPTLST
jgi:L-proline amide hydrolase